MWVFIICLGKKFKITIKGEINKALIILEFILSCYYICNIAQSYLTPNLFTPENSIVAPEGPLATRWCPRNNLVTCWPLSPVLPTIIVGRQPYVISLTVWWVGNSPHDDDNGDDGERPIEGVRMVQASYGEGVSVADSIWCNDYRAHNNGDNPQNYLNPIEFLRVEKTHWLMLGTWTTWRPLTHRKYGAGGLMRQLLKAPMWSQ